MRPPTSDVENGLMAVASVGNVGGDTAENSSIHLPHACHLEDPHWQKSVSGHGGKGISDFRHDKNSVYKFTNLNCTVSSFFLTESKY